MKRIFYFLFFLVFLSWHTAFSQQQYSITGRIIDGKAALPGVTIKTKDNSIATQSNLDGTFRITGIKQGNYELVFSYLGYEPIEKTVSVSEKPFNVYLGDLSFSGNDAQDIDEVVVQGIMANTQAKALSIQKSSPAIMNVIASDLIGKLPDRNAAEAVQRIQGIAIERDHGEGRYASVRGTPMQWNSTLVNGNRMPTSEGTSDNTSGSRTSPLDIFPSEMIEFVQVSKAITPDMEGDAIGGSINFVTRTAPVSKTLKASLGTGYNGQAQKGIYSGSFMYGDHFFNKKLSLIIGGSYWKRNWATDNTEAVYNQEDFAMESFELRDYKGVRTTMGLNAGLAYHINPSHKIFFRGILTDFQDQETALEHTFSYTGKTLTQRRREGVIGIGLLGAEIGGTHNTLGEKLNIHWKLSNYETDMETRKPSHADNPKNTYKLSMFASKVDFANRAADGKMYLDMDAPAGFQSSNYQSFVPQLKSAVKTSDLRLTQLIELQTQSFERDRIAELDLKYQLNNNIYFKAGGKFKGKYLRRGSPMDIYVNRGANITVESLATEAYDYNGGFMKETGADYHSVLLDGITLTQVDQLLTDSYINENKLMHIARGESSPDAASSFYTGNEDVYAGYGMFDMKLSDKLQLIAGARYEHTALTYYGNEVIRKNVDGKPTADINKVENSSKFGSLLPMAHLKYQPIEAMNIRLAYTRTFARANFSDLNPTENINLIFTPPVISRGNIALKPTFAHNFYFMSEYYFDDIGVASFGVFYKKLSNVIYSSQSFQQIDGTTYRITQPENSENGWLAGFEAGISKRLSFLPGFWSGFGIEANYTMTTSEMEVPRFSLDEKGQVTKTIAKEVLPNQSKHLFNTAIFYEKGKFMARIAGNYKGSALAIVQGNPENYRWYGENFTMDFSANYRFNNKVSVFAELNNLTNAPLRYYHGDSRRLEQLEYYSLRGLVGINYQIF